MPPLTVEIELFERDVVLAHFWTLFQLSIVRFLVGIHTLLLLFLVLFVVRSLTREPESLAPIAGAAALLVVFGLAPLRVWQRAKLQFASLGASGRRGTYTFSEDGVSWSMGRATGELPWTAVSRWSDRDDYLFFMTRTARPHVIPKRCLTKEQRESLGQRGPLATL